MTLLLLSIVALSEGIISQHAGKVHLTKLHKKGGKMPKNDQESADATSLASVQQAFEEGSKARIPSQSQSQPGTNGVENFVKKVFAGRATEEGSIGKKHEEDGEQEFNKAFHDYIDVGKKMLRLRDSNLFKEAKHLAEDIGASTLQKTGSIAKQMKVARFEMQDSVRQKNVSAGPDRQDQGEAALATKANTNGSKPWWESEDALRLSAITTASKPWLAQPTNGDCARIMCSLPAPGTPYSLPFLWGFGINGTFFGTNGQPPGLPRPDDETNGLLEPPFRVGFFKPTFPAQAAAFCGMMQMPCPPNVEKFTKSVEEIEAILKWNDDLIDANKYCPPGTNLKDTTQSDMCKQRQVERVLRDMPEVTGKQKCTGWGYYRRCTAPNSTATLVQYGWDGTGFRTPLAVGGPCQKMIVSPNWVRSLGPATCPPPYPPSGWTLNKLRADLQEIQMNTFPFGCGMKCAYDPGSQQCVAPVLLETAKSLAGRQNQVFESLEYPNNVVKPPQSNGAYLNCRSPSGCATYTGPDTFPKPDTLTWNSYDETEKSLYEQCRERDQVWKIPAEGGVDSNADLTCGDVLCAEEADPKFCGGLQNEQGCWKPITNFEDCKAKARKTGLCKWILNDVSKDFQRLDANGTGNTADLDVASHAADSADVFKGGQCVASAVDTDYWKERVLGIVQKGHLQPTVMSNSDDDSRYTGVEGDRWFKCLGTDKYVWANGQATIRNCRFCVEPCFNPNGCEWDGVGTFGTYGEGDVHRRRRVTGFSGQAATWAGCRDPSLCAPPSPPPTTTQQPSQKPPSQKRIVGTPTDTGRAGTVGVVPQHLPIPTLSPEDAAKQEENRREAEALAAAKAAEKTVADHNAETQAGDTAATPAMPHSWMAGFEKTIEEAGNVTKKFPISNKSVAKLRSANFALSLGGGGCVAVTTQTGFMDVLNFVGAGRFHEAQSGTSGGFWKAMMDWTAGEIPERTLSLLDPVFGVLPPQSRTESILEKMGCQGGQYMQCNMKMLLWAREHKMSVFGSATGCILDGFAAYRGAIGMQKCQEYYMKSEGRRQCGFLNQQKGFVSSVLPPRRNVPVSVELTDLTIEGVTKPRRELFWPVEGEPVYYTFNSIGASMLVFSTTKIPEIPEGIDFNRSVDLGKQDGTDKHTILTEWEKWKNSKEAFYFESRPTGSAIPQHNVLDIAAMASNLASAGLMESLILLSSGLCVPSGSGKVTTRNVFLKILEPIFLPMMKLWVQAEHSSKNTDILQRIMKSWPKSVSTIIQSYWDKHDGWVFTAPPKKLHCEEKNVSKWLAEDNSQLFYGMDGKFKAYQRFAVPCFFDDESFTTLVLREMLTPKGNLIRTVDGKEAFGELVIADAGGIDPLGLGTLMNALFSDVKGVRFPKRNKNETWHVLLLNSAEEGWDYDPVYWSEYSSIKSQMSGKIVETLEDLGADCSKTSALVKNVNRIFVEDAPKETKGNNVLTQTLHTVRNNRFEVDAGEEIEFSVADLASKDLDQYFKPYLPKDFTLYKTDFLDTTGFTSPFEAWVTMYKGQLAGVQWLCSQLMDVDDCTEVMKNPWTFLVQLRHMYLAAPDPTSGQVKLPPVQVPVPLVP